MNRLALAIVALLALAPSAHANDPERPLSWTGFYVGAHLGHGWADWNGTLEYDPGTGPVDIFNNDPHRNIGASGWLGGAQVGAMQQWGSLVLGVVLDGSRTNIEGDATFALDPDANKDTDYTWRIKTRVDAFGTARLNLGITTGPMLWYATGGLAFARTSGDLTVTCMAPQCGAHAPLVTARGAADENHLGYALGGGMAWMMGGGWFVNLEYLYLNFGEASYRLKGTAYPTGPSPPFPAPFPHTTDSFRSDLDMHIVRFGLNYKF